MPNNDQIKLVKERENQEEKKRRLALVRTCGECQACCTTHGVSELPKSPETRCIHLAKPPLFGCSIYEARPQGCRIWNCVWRAEPNTLGDNLRPDKLGVVYDCQMLPGLDFPVIFARETEKDGFTRYLVDHTTQGLVAKGNLVVYIRGKEKVVVELVQGPKPKVGAYLALLEELTRKQEAETASTEPPPTQPEGPHGETYGG